MLSCKKKPNDFEPEDENNLINIYQSEMIQLGKQLQNPYTVANMQAAYNILKQKYGESVPDITISTTHRYMKFAPAHDSIYRKMLKDTTVELFSYPLDYEILNTGGLYYHDPNLPDSIPTYQYAAVDLTYSPDDAFNPVRSPLKSTSILSRTKPSISNNFIVNMFPVL